MSMDIYAKRGSNVLVTKETAHNGYNDDSEQVEAHLQIGKLYTIHKIIVESSSTTVYLREFPELSWNSVNFINYVPKPIADDFNEPTESGELVKFNSEAFGFAMRKWNRENIAQIEAREMYKEGTTKLSDTEMIVSAIKAYNKDSNGCLRHKKHVMISYQKADGVSIYDLFLNKDQAIDLLDTLTKALDND